jgi:hypothetical protein
MQKVEKELEKNGDKVLKVKHGTKHIIKDLKLKLKEKNMSFKELLKSLLMKYSKDIGVNWHLRFRQIIKDLQDELEVTQIQLEIAERKLKKYEDNHIRSTRNRKDNNVVKLSGRIYKNRD